MEELGPVVDIRGLAHGVPDRQLIIDLDLTVGPGGSVAVLGPSGAGKTTLLHLIAGIVAVQRGCLEVAGADLTTMSSDQRAAHRLRHVGLVFQFAELLPELSVRENVTLPGRLLGADPGGARIAADRWLERVRLEGCGDRRPASLSGGEMQRVAIARALAHEPALVLADEPTGSLDQATGLQVASMLVDITKATRRALIMVTHDPAVADLAERSVVLADGRLDSRSSFAQPR